MALRGSRKQQELENAWLVGLSAEKLCASHHMAWTKKSPKRGEFERYDDVSIRTKRVFVKFDEPSLHRLECQKIPLKAPHLSSEKETLLQTLRNEFKQAEKILELQEDWDGEGSPAYKKETLDRAIHFVRSHAELMYESFGIALDTPDIGPGPDGAIDVHWCTPRYELLVSIPVIESEPATYYGDDYGGSVVRGSFDSSKVNMGFLQLWQP